MKRKYIIALSGEDGSGKTETLQALIDKLGFKNESRKWKNWIARGAYKNTGITMAVHCGGDKINEVIAELQEYVDNNVQIIVTAVHPGKKNIGKLQATFSDYTVVEFMKFKMSTIQNVDPEIQKLFEKAWGKVIGHYVDVLLEFIDELLNL